MSEFFVDRFNGSTNCIIENFVSDIQDKYSDIKKLEEVLEAIFSLYCLKYLEC